MTVPTVASEGDIEIMPGLTIKVLVLDNGQRIVPVEDFGRVLKFLGITPEEFTQMMAGDNR
ncbi:TPA: hypothetical protein KNG84_001627 [Serratia fonticola]|nr:hypothetical protein [Serratia fonticola]